MVEPDNQQNAGSQSPNQNQSQSTAQGGGFNAAVVSNHAIDPFSLT